MIRREDDGLWVVLRETIAMHHDEVFACLTTSEGLSRWFPVAAQIDLRQGGEIVFCWDADCTKTSTIAILDYDPEGKIVWDWYATSNDMHAPVYWTVKPSVEKGARIEMRQGPFHDDVESLIAMAEEAESWRWQLCNLRSVLEVKHDMRAVRPL
jgi:uncharacterized protein YndB with AHSA1/START domain